MLLLLMNTLKCPANEQNKVTDDVTKQFHGQTVNYAFVVLSVEWNKRSVLA